MEKINFEGITANLKSMGFQVEPERLHLEFENSAELIKKGLDYFGQTCGFSPKWLNEYNQLAEWLNDNKGKGLLLFGNCGRGKTLFAAKILPVLVNWKYRKVLNIFNSQTMNKSLDQILKGNFLRVLDDVGIEEALNCYGNKRMAFSEIVDDYERKGGLLIVTTNLTLSEIAAKYGARTLDRLRGTTKCIQFSGESLRG